MFLRWGERRLSALHPVLLAERESGALFAVMTGAALTLKRSSQRMSVPIAEIGRRLNMDPSQLSRVVKRLQALDVLQLPEAFGKSRTFELDARLVTHMDEAERKAAARRQSELREADRAAEAARAERRKKRARVVPLRVVHAEDAGPIVDGRQPSLV